MLKNKHDGTYKAHLFFIIVFPAIVFLYGCSSSAPEIIRLKYQVNAFSDQQAGEKYERLAVFIQVNDLDGLDDIAELSIRHETNGISWTFTRETWESMLLQEETWIGSNALVMSDYSPIPDGNYIVSITDLAGYTKDTTFSLSGSPIELKDLNFPSISFKKDSATLVSPEPILMWFYSSTGDYLYGHQFAPGDIGLSIFDRPGQNGILPDKIYLYSFNNEKGFGIMSGPFRLP